MEPATKEQKLEAERARFERLKVDPTAIGEVYDLYAPQLYGFVFKRCAHAQTAEDIVSQTFVRLLESLPTLEWRNVPLSAWLYQVASNALIDLSRKASTKRETALETDAWDPPSADDPSWNAELRISGERLREAMKELSDRDQLVLDLRFFAGLEAPEIAAQLGIGANHASVLVYRAIGRLRAVCIRNNV